MIRCEYTGTKGQPCGNEATHAASWPTHSHRPRTHFYCDSHVATVTRIPNCHIQTMREGKHEQ